MDNEDLNGHISWAQTIGAMVVSVVAFFVLLYVVAPIIETLLNLFGGFFVPARYGGGSEVDNPGILTLAIRAIIASGLSAVGAFMAAFRLFTEAHAKSVAIVFAIAVLAWAGFFAYVGFSSGVILEPLVLIGLGAAPPLVVAFWAWRGEL